MKLTLVLALAFSFAAAKPYTDFTDSEDVSEAIFRPGFEYVYRYESQVLSGIRTASSQVGGVKINAIVKCQIHRGGSCTLKMEHVTVHKVNDVVSGLPEAEMVPDHQMTRLSGEQEQTMVEELNKPIKFKYEDGEVRDIQTTRGDKYWSINIKKGLASMFQVKLNSRSSLSWSDSDSDSDSDSWSLGSSSSISGRRSIRNRLYETFNPLSSRRLQTPRMDDTYKVMETDVNGECETKYVINSDKSSDLTSVSQMTVTKVKNFDKCLGKNTFDQGLFAHLPHLKSEKKLIEPSFEAEYTMSGDRHHFLIKKASVQAKYFFKPYGPEGGQLSTHINQKLSLKQTRQIESLIRIDGTVFEKYGLKMEIPKGSFQPESLDTDNYAEQDWRQLIDAKLNKLIESIYPVMHETATAELFQLQMIVRDCPHRQLASIVKSYVHDNSHADKKGEILLDILPTCISRKSGKVLIDLVRDGTIRGIRAPLSISAMVLTVKPSPQIVKSLLSLYDQQDIRSSSDISSTSSMLRQTAILGAGTLCNKMINHMRRVKKPIPEFTSAVEETAQELTSKLEECQSEKEKMVILKAMGNMGAKEIISPVKSVIHDKSQPKIVRAEAVIALRKVAKTFSKIVHPILLSTALDQSERDSVRIASVSVLKDSQPSFTSLQLLAHSTRNESTSTQIKTFIYTTLISMARDKSPQTEQQQCTKDARKVLKTMRAIPIGAFDSKDIVGSGFSSRLNMGFTYNMEMIKSKRSGMPHGIFKTLHATIFGNHLKIAKVGADGDMVSTILRRLIGPYGLLKKIVNNQASVYDLLRPLTGAGRETTSEWMDFINRKSFRSFDDEEQIDGLVYGQLLGYDVFAQKFDQQTVEQLVNYAVSRGPQLIRKLKEGISLNTLKTLSLTSNSLVMPTPAGIPLSLNVSANAIVKLDGFVRARSLPSIADFMRRRPFLNKNIELETQIKPSISSEMFGYMGVDLSVMRTGVALKGHVVSKLPLKAELIVNPQDGKMVVRVEPPTENQKALVAKIEPVTFVFLVPQRNAERLPFEYELKRCRSHQQIEKSQYEKRYQCHITGLEFDMAAKWTKCGATWCPYYPLTGKQQITFGIRSLSSTPKEIVVQVKKFTQNWYEEDENQESSYPMNRNYGHSYESEMEQFVGDFDQVQPDQEYIPSSSTARKVEMLVQLSLNGYRDEKKLKTKITWMTDNSDYKKHQLNVQLVAVPCDGYGKFKLMLDSVIRAPHMSEIYGVETSNKPIGKLDINWGRTGFSEQTIRCKLWQLDGNTWRHELQNENAEDSYELAKSLHGCSPKAFRGALEITFPQQIGSVGRQYLTKAHDFVKFGLYRYLTVGIPEHLPQNKLVIYGQFVTKIEKLSVIVKSPRETNMILNVPVQCPWSRFYQPSLHDVNPRFLYTNLTERCQNDFDLFGHPNCDNYYDNYRDYSPSLQGECKIHKDKMLSFDGTPILLPVHSGELDTSSSRCDVLLARDCRPESRSSFAVTGSMKRGKWSVKVTVPEKLIELVPERLGGSEQRVEVIVNGEPVSVQHSTPVTLYEQQQNPSSDAVATVKKSGDGVEVKLHKIGVTVKLNERSQIKIKVSATSGLQGRLCGLCGNNNYDLSDDMTSSMGDKLSNGRQFVLDNVLPSDYCNVNDYETLVNNRHSGFCMTKKTIMTESVVRGQPTVCFSKRSVRTCRKGCSPTSSTSTRVPCLCLPYDSPEVDDLVDKLESGMNDLSYELEELQRTRSGSSYGGNGVESWDKEIEMPDSCSPSSYGRYY